jgi:aryl-alcohol dehydrogenase-like predicted oxidoreductase
MRPDATVPLGRTALAVTQLGLGTGSLAPVGDAPPDEDSYAVVERAWELGVRFFDTAPLYGHGESERRLGRALADKPRDEFVLATKVGRLLRPEPVFNFSFDGVLRSFEESLERLGLDRVDIVHIHDPDDHLDEAIAGAYPALDRLRSEGTITAVGAGMNSAEPLVRLANEAEFDCFLLAGRYTLLDRSGAEELLPLCERRDIGIVAGGPYNSGVLARPRPGATYDYAPAAPEVIERAQRLEQVCLRHGVPLMAAAIQFPLDHPAIASVVTGACTVAELEENVRMLETPVPDATWEELAAV